MYTKMPIYQYIPKYTNIPIYTKIYQYTNIYQYTICKLDFHELEWTPSLSEADGLKT